MTIKDLILELEKLGSKIGFDSEVWVATNGCTEPMDDVSECVDLDTNIIHAQLASKQKRRYW